MTIDIVSDTGRTILAVGLLCATWLASTAAGITPAQVWGYLTGTF